MIALSVSEAVPIEAAYTEVLKFGPSDGEVAVATDGLFDTNVTCEIVPFSAVVVAVIIRVSPKVISALGILIVQVGGGVTLTITLSDLVPLGPEHVRVNVLLAVNGPLAWPPDGTALLPLQEPDAVQVVTLAVVHESDTVVPDVMVRGPFELSARKSTLGTPGAGVGPMPQLALIWACVSPVD
jgi:hypothetical protein